MSGLIAFFGPDGSGKSTQASLLADYLKSKGLKVKKIWIRSPHTAAYLLSKFLMRFGFFRVLSNPYGKSKRIFALPKDSKLRFLWYFVELFSVEPLIILKVKVPLLFGYSIVAERYVVDTIVNIAYYSTDLTFLRSRIAKLFLTLFSKGAIFIHLDSDYFSILRRRSQKADAAEFIEFQRNAYRIVNESIRAATLHTDERSVSGTFDRILTILRI